MRKSILILCCLFLAAISMASCSNSNNKVFTSEVEVVGDGNYRRTFVNLDGKAYTGTVWANDESCYQTFKNGIVTGGVIFHKNGKKALEIKFANPGEKGDDTFNCFDEDGNPMSESQFGEKYSSLLSSTENKLPVR